MTNQVDGAEALKIALAAFYKDVGKEVGKAIFKGGRLVQSAAIQSIQKPQGVGQWVTRYHSGQKPYQHLASAPGQAPNTDTGELVRGIQVEIKGSDVIVGVESSQDEKALALEFGNEDGTLAPRPFLFPALEQNRQKIDDLIAEAIAKQINEANT